MMEAIINDFVKSKGVHVILSKSVFHGMLDVFYYNWVAPNDLYYSLLVPCSETMVYTTSSLEFKGEILLSEAIGENLRVFHSKDDWHSGRWEREFAKNYNRALAMEMRTRSRYCITVGGYRVMQTKFHTQPMLGVTIWYYGEGTVKVLTVWYGSVTRVYASDTIFSEFIEALGISQCVEIVWKRPTSEGLRIEGKICK